MQHSTLAILRCPYCGGRLELISTMFHRVNGDEVHDGILGCYCCIFPVVAGIPVMHLREDATRARAHVEAGEVDAARRTMFGLDDAVAARFDAVATSSGATYLEAVDALGPDSEFRYFLYRFSDPSYRVAHQLVRAVAGTVLRGGGRAVDICGGSGHLTRALMDLSTPAPVLADLFFLKMWLARRFTAPGCEAVCCDANEPLPFARGAFRYAMCADAFMFIWMKRHLVQEMLRVVDDHGTPGAVLISHAHNQREWSPSHGQPLPPEGYYDLFETIAPRMFAEAGLLTDIVRGGPLDLSRRDSADVMDRDPALAIIASNHPGVFVPHALDPAPGAPGELRINPLYAVQAENGHVRLSLRFPSSDYEDEFGGCRAYLPEEVVIDAASMAAIRGGSIPPALVDLGRRGVVLDLPRRYY